MRQIRLLLLGMASLLATAVPAHAAPAGSLDRSFSGDGRQTTDFAGREDSGEAVAVQRDGKVVVAGVVEGESGDSNFALARYNADGSLDTSFSGDGRQTTDFAGGYDSGEGVAVQRDGKIVVGGHAEETNRGSLKFALARYNADGSLDRSFSGDGRQTTDFPGRFDGDRDLAVQPDGKVVAAGKTEWRNNANFAVARYNADGSLDTSFSGDGRQTTDFSGGRGRGPASPESPRDFGEDVAVQRDGRIVVAGSAYEGANVGYNFALARYNAGGSLDRSFSGDGRQTTDFSGGRDGSDEDLGHGVALQPDGKIVVGGSISYPVCCGAAPPREDFGLTRYHAGGSRPRPRPACTITGTSRSDVLVGTPGDDVICAGGGNDVVRAGRGDDTVYGGRGNDVLRADAGSDRLYGQSGNDVLRTSDGKRGNDSADGGTGNDACHGDTGDRRRSCWGR